MNVWKLKRNIIKCGLTVSPIRISRDTGAFVIANPIRVRRDADEVAFVPKIVRNAMDGRLAANATVDVVPNDGTVEIFLRVDDAYFRGRSDDELNAAAAIISALKTASDAVLGYAKPTKENKMTRRKFEVIINSDGTATVTIPFAMDSDVYSALVDWCTAKRIGIQVNDDGYARVRMGDRVSTTIKYESHSDDYRIDVTDCDLADVLGEIEFLRTIPTNVREAIDKVIDFVGRSGC